MRVIITCFGSGGDTFPFLALAEHLASRGHHVRALINGHYLPAAKRLALDAHAVGEPADPAVVVANPEFMHPWRGTINVLRDLLVPHSRDLHSALLHHADDFQPQLIISHQISFAAPWVAHQLGIPFIGAAIAPAAFPSVHDPNRYPGMPDLDCYPRWTVRLGTAFATWMMRRQVDPPLNDFRRELGLPPLRDQLMRRMFEGSATLALWSPAYRPHAPDDPNNATITGFPFLPHAQPDEPVREFLDEGEPPIVVSFGTTAVHLADRLYREAAHAAAALDRRALLLVGTQDACERLHPLPAGVMSYPAAPHEAVFPRAACVIHHGGMGTTAQALRSGRPAVIVPFSHDQFDNARRCRLHRCAVALPKRKATPQGLRRAIERALAPTHELPARDIAERIRAEHAGDAAERAIKAAIGEHAD